MTPECTRSVLNRDCLLTFPTCAQHQERDVLLAFNEDLGNALVKACELDTDTDAVHLAPLPPLHLQGGPLSHSAKAT